MTDKLPHDYVIAFEDFALEDDGTMDTVITFAPENREISLTWRYDGEFASHYRDISGCLRLGDFLREVVIPDLESDCEIWAS